MTEELKAVEAIKQQLEIFNDKQFRFVKKPHKYYYGDTELISVTTFIKNFHKEFDADYWSRKKATEYGCSVDTVLKMWETKKNAGCDHGNIVHDYIENLYKGKSPKMPKDENAKICIEKFLQYKEEKMGELIPVAMERLVFDLDWGISGMIDSLFYGRGKLWLGDWKTNKKFRHDSDYNYNQRMLYPFSDLKDNEFNRYSIQVSLYRIILEKQGILTEGCFICHIPLDGKVCVYKATDHRERLYKYFDKKLYTKLIPENDELLQLF